MFLDVYCAMPVNKNDKQTVAFAASRNNSGWTVAVLLRGPPCLQTSEAAVARLQQTGHLVCTFRTNQEKGTHRFRSFRSHVAGVLSITADSMGYGGALNAAVAAALANSACCRSTFGDLVLF